MTNTLVTCSNAGASNWEVVVSVIIAILILSCLGIVK